MFKEPLNEDNPLTIYKRRNALTLEDLRDQTGLAVITLCRLCRRDSKNIGLTTYNTIITIKEKLGIDLMEGEY